MYFVNVHGQRLLSALEAKYVVIINFGSGAHFDAVIMILPIAASEESRIVVVL